MHLQRVQCFKCRSSFLNPADLFVHIKEVHKICGNSVYTCTCSCTGFLFILVSNILLILSSSEIFNAFGAYKKHVNSCFNKVDVNDEEEVANQTLAVDAYNAVEMKDENVLIFQKTMEAEALKLTCKLNGIMMLPRSLVYKTITDFSKFLQTMVEGMVLIKKYCVLNLYTIVCICDAFLFLENFSNSSSLPLFILISHGYPLKRRGCVNA